MLLLGILAVGLVGTGAELLLMGHDETATQIVPLGLIVVGVAVIAWNLVAASRASVTALRLTMAAFVAGGILGCALHYQGSVEFQKELDPSMHGFDLFAKVMQSKAPPPLAPGAFVYFGVMGLGTTYLFAVRRDRRETI